MKFVVAALLLTMPLMTSSAKAGEVIIVEESFANPIDLPKPIETELLKSLTETASTCLADSNTTVREAIEASFVDLGISVKSIMLKPKDPSLPGAAWGCVCGAYYCPMWIFSLKGSTSRRLWWDYGNLVEVIDRKDRGLKRLLISSGTAGHQERSLYAWNGKRYTVLRKKQISGVEVNEKGYRDLEKFRSDAIC